jgi:hypothetical protein
MVSLSLFFEWNLFRHSENLQRFHLCQRLAIHGIGFLKLTRSCALDVLQNRPQTNLYGSPPQSAGGQEDCADKTGRSSGPVWRRRRASSTPAPPRLPNATNDAAATLAARCHRAAPRCASTRWRRTCERCRTGRAFQHTCAAPALASNFSYRNYRLGQTFTTSKRGRSRLRDLSACSGRTTAPALPGQQVQCAQEGQAFRRMGTGWEEEIERPATPGEGLECV